MTRRSMHVTRTITALSVLAAVSVGLLATPPRAEAGFPGGNGKIAFFSGRDGNYEIYVMNADGTGQTRLTDNPAGDATGAWSP